MYNYCNDGDVMPLGMLHFSSTFRSSTEAMCIWHTLLILSTCCHQLDLNLANLKGRVVFLHLVHSETAVQ